VPTDDRLRFDKDPGRAPAPPSCCQTCPEESVPSGPLRPLEGALENGELVPQSQHLHLKGRTAAKAIPRRCQNGQHRWSWGEETEDAQLSMYQADRNLREGQWVPARSDASPARQRTTGRFSWRSNTRSKRRNARQTEPASGTGSAAQQLNLKGGSTLSRRLTQKGGSGQHAQLTKAPLQSG